MTLHIDDVQRIGKPERWSKAKTGGLLKRGWAPALKRLARLGGRPARQGMAAMGVARRSAETSRRRQATGCARARASEPTQDPAV